MPSRHSATELLANIASVSRSDLIRRVRYQNPSHASLLLAVSVVATLLQRRVTFMRLSELGGHRNDRRALKSCKRLVSNRSRDAE